MHRIRRLTERHAREFRAIRLASLREHSDRAAYDEEASKQLAWFADRLATQLVLGVPLAGARLGGLVALDVARAATGEPIGLVWGLYVRPRRRRAGLGYALLQSLVREAQYYVDELRLAVGSNDLPAIRLYEKVGFRRYGLKPQSLKLGGLRQEEALMALDVRLPTIADPHPTSSLNLDSSRHGSTLQRAS